jgi:hypothetical protein
MRKSVTQVILGKTFFIVTSECSPNAKETIDKKLERLILRHAADAKSYRRKSGGNLAMFENQSEYRADTMV